MKESIKNLRNGLLFGIGASLIIVASLIIYTKARTTTNPTTSDDWQWMYTTAGTSLTAAKWNNLVNRSVFRAYLNTTDTVSTTASKVIMNTELFDTNDEFDTSTYRFTPKRAGKYVLTALAQFPSVWDTNWGHIDIYKNGSLYAMWSYAVNWGAWSNNSIVTTVVDANWTTDYFEAYARATKSVTLSVWNSYTYFAGYRVE